MLSRAQNTFHHNPRLRGHVSSIYIYIYIYIYRIQGECLLISSLPGKALGTRVGIARLAERFYMRSRSRAW